MSFEYKVVGAPERGKRRRGARTRSDRVAAAMEELIQAEAAEGWDYLRTDLIPVEEKTSWSGRIQEVHRAVLVFRRERPGSRVPAMPSMTAAQPQMQAMPLPMPAQPQPQGFLRPAPVPPSGVPGEPPLAAPPPTADYPLRLRPDQAVGAIQPPTGGLADPWSGGRSTRPPGVWPGDDRS